MTETATRAPLTRRRLLSGGGTVAMLVATTGCGRANRSDAQADQTGPVTRYAAADRREVERITGRLLGGGRFDSADLSGSVVVYNVWGSWCPPCREEAPALRRVSTELRSAGVRFVGINVRDNDAAAKAFVANYGLDYPSLRTDSSSQAILAFGGGLPANAVPSTLVVDGQGRLAARIIGPTTYATLKGLVTDVLRSAADRGRSTRRDR